MGRIKKEKKEKKINPSMIRNTLLDRFSTFEYGNPIVSMMRWSHQRNLWDRVTRDYVKQPKVDLTDAILSGNCGFHICIGCDLIPGQLSGQASKVEGNEMEIIREWNSCIEFVMDYYNLKLIRLSRFRFESGTIRADYVFEFDARAMALDKILN